MSEPSDVKIGPNWLSEWQGEGYGPEWYMQELPEEIEERRRGVQVMNMYANKLMAEQAIEEAEDADVRWTFWAGFACGIICTAMLSAAVWLVWVPR